MVAPDQPLLLRQARRPPQSADEIPNLGPAANHPSAALLTFFGGHARANVVAFATVLGHSCRPRDMHFLSRECHSLVSTRESPSIWTR